MALNRFQEKCTVASSGKVEAVGDTPTNTRIIHGNSVTNAAGFRIIGNRATLINRGLISGRHGDNNQWGQGIAIGGTHAKVINYGTIKTSNQNAFGVLIATSAHTPVLEFLSGRVYVDHHTSEVIHSFAQDTRSGSSYPGVKLTLGGVLGKARSESKIIRYDCPSQRRDHFAAGLAGIGRRQV